MKPTIIKCRKISKGQAQGEVIYQMHKNNTAPLAIIALEAEPIIATGAIMAAIPMVDQPNDDIFNLMKDGDLVNLNADECKIKILEK